MLRATRPTRDGGYIAAGVAEGPMGRYSRGLLLKLDASGAIAWQQSYGLPANTDGRFAFIDVMEAPDGGFVAVGTYRQDSVALRDQALVMKVDAGGSVGWVRAFGMFGSSLAVSVQRAADGTLLVGGTFESMPASGAWVARLDFSGGVLSQKVYGTPGDRGNALIATPDAGALLVGRRGLVNPGTGGGHWDFWAIKLDAAGDVQWQRTFGGLGEDVASAVLAAPDGGFILAGYSGPGPGALMPSDAWVLKVASDGAIPGCALAGDSQAPVTAYTAPPDQPNVESFAVSVQTFGVTIAEAALPFRPSLRCFHDDALTAEVPALSPLLATLLAAILGLAGAARLALPR